MYDEIDSFINNYDNYESYDYTPEEIENVENFLEALLGGCGMDMFESNKPKKKEEKKESKAEDKKVIPLPAIQPEEKIEEHTIAFSFENNDDVVRFSCTDEDLFVIEENDYEVVLNKQQMEFIMECYLKMSDLFKSDK